MRLFLAGLLRRLGLDIPEHRHKLRILATSASLPIQGEAGTKSKVFLQDMFGRNGLWKKDTSHFPSKEDNKVFGYYLEVRNASKDLVPDEYIRKQTLVNAERYITPKLKEVEAEVLGAQNKINKRKYSIILRTWYCSLAASVTLRLSSLSVNASSIFFLKASRFSAVTMRMPLLIRDSNH